MNVSETCVNTFVENFQCARESIERGNFPSGRLTPGLTLASLRSSE